MEGTNSTGEANGLVARVKGLLLQPQPTWERIDAEPATIGGLYRSYILPLAAIPALCGLIGALVFGHSALGVTWRPSISSAIGTAIVQYVLTLIGVAVLAFVIDALAPTFAGTKNRIQAFKVAAYSATAGWVAGVFGLLPSLAWLSILGLYSLYLLYLGLPRLMKAPAEKAMGYTAAVVVAAIVLFLVIGAITAPVAGLFGPGGGPDRSGSMSGTLAVPGVGKVDLGKLEEASRNLEQAAAGGDGAVEPVDPAILESLLPASAAGLPRTSIESASGGVGGIGGSRVEAVYGEGDRRLTVEVVDMAAMGGLAALGSAFNVRSDSRTETGYERVGTVDGRMTVESWDERDRSGKYGMLVANRFMIEAEGRGIEMATLKQAVTALNTGALEKAARR